MVMATVTAMVAIIEIAMASMVNIADMRVTIVANYQAKKWMNLINI
jgi:hypothetical protein